MEEGWDSRLFGPTAEGRLGLARQTDFMIQGERDCVSIVMHDGRTLVCTPDHEILCADGCWKRADQLVLGQDRAVVGLEAPLDEVGASALRDRLYTPGELLRLNQLTPDPVVADGLRATPNLFSKISTDKIDVSDL